MVQKWNSIFNVVKELEKLSIAEKLRTHKVYSNVQPIKPSGI